MRTAWNAFPMLDRLFDDVMHGVSGTALGTASNQGTFTPAIDVRANDDEIVFVCDVPGLKHEDLDISVDNDVLTIKGRRKYQGSDKDRVWLGRSYGSFARSFTLPEAVNAEAIKADLTDGVLTVSVPRQPKPKPRRIQIATGPIQNGADDKTRAE